MDDDADVETHKAVRLLIVFVDCDVIVKISENDATNDEAWKSLGDFKRESIFAHTPR